MSFVGLNEKNWRALILAIQKGGCILMLGPDAAVEEVEGKPRPLMEILANQLAEDIHPSIKENINTSNLTEVAQHYVMDKDLGRNSLEVEVSAFYHERQSKCSQLHRDLAALPFYFTITSSHDNMFYEALEQKNKEPAKARYHFKGRNPSIVEMGTVETPLIFYLYGCVEEPPSLVLTENDLLEFLVAIISKKPLPDRILTEVNAKNKNFLFLGFGFKHWFQRILLHVMQDREKDSPSFAMEQFTPHNVDEFKSTLLFFQESSSKIHIFTNELSIFAKELRKRYEESICIPGPASEIESDNAAKVFICHANENKSYAETLFEKMKDAGLNPWLDKENISGGEEWDKLIKKTINESDYFVILQSKALHEKHYGYVNKEIYEALERKKLFRGLQFIIPIKIEDCHSLEELVGLETIDFTKGKTIDDLIKTIKRDFAKRGKW